MRVCGTCIYTFPSDLHQIVGSIPMLQEWRRRMRNKASSFLGQVFATFSLCTSSTDVQVIPSQQSLKTERTRTKHKIAGKIAGVRRWEGEKTKRRSHSKVISTAISYGCQVRQVKLSWTLGTWHVPRCRLTRTGSPLRGELLWAQSSTNELCWEMLVFGHVWLSLALFNLKQPKTFFAHFVDEAQ